MADVCETCHEHPATVHLCEIIDGRQTTLDLCQSCFRARSASTGVDLPLLNGTQKCYYCGASAQCGGMNQSWEQEIRKQKFHFTCFRCGQMEHQLMIEAMEAMPKGLSQDEQMLAIQKAILETDRRVREQAQGDKS